MGRADGLVLTVFGNAGDDMSFDVRRDGVQVGTIVCRPVVGSRGARHGSVVSVFGPDGMLAHMASSLEQAVMWIACVGESKP